MNEQKLLEYLLRKHPVVTDRVLAEYLGGDYRGNYRLRDSVIGQVTIETLNKLSQTLRSEIIFRPFEGVYQVSVDERGRIQFPSEFRYILDPAMDPILTVIKKDWTVSLSLYPRNLYGEEEPLPFRPEINLDEYDRLSIPKYLREIAGIGKYAVVVGAIDQVVIADETKFREFITK